jgi:hypothetical protein
MLQQNICNVRQVACRGVMIRSYQCGARLPGSSHCPGKQQLTLRPAVCLWPVVLAGCKKTRTIRLTS